MQFGHFYLRPNTIIVSDFLWNDKIEWATLQRQVERFMRFIHQEPRGIGPILPYSTWLHSYLRQLIVRYCNHQSIPWQHITVVKLSYAEHKCEHYRIASRLKLPVTLHLLNLCMCVSALCFCYLLIYLSCFRTLISVYYMAQLIMVAIRYFKQDRLNLVSGQTRWIHFYVTYKYGIKAKRFYIGCTHITDAFHKSNLSEHIKFREIYTKRRTKLP